METETVINGTHEETPEEKILKLKRSPIVSNKKENNADDNSKPQTNGNLENGHDQVFFHDLFSEDFEEKIKNLNKNSIENEIDNEEKVRSVKELTPQPETPTKRGRKKRDSTPLKETSKRQGTPVKRDLRTRETTPKESVQKKDGPQKKRGRTPSKTSSNKVEADETQTITHEVEKSESTSVKKTNIIKEEETSVINEHVKKNVNENGVETNETEHKNQSPPGRVTSSSSTFTTESKEDYSIYKVPLTDHEEHVTEPTTYSYSSEEGIQSRKPINPFSSFPGSNNVSISPANRSLKRKAENERVEEYKRFAGEIETSKEKSPGWNFFSSSWSPVEKSSKSPFQNSTPFPKRSEQDSMVANYGEDTEQNLDEAEEVKEKLASSGRSITKQKDKFRCSVM